MRRNGQFMRCVVFLVASSLVTTPAFPITVTPSTCAAHRLACASALFCAKRRHDELCAPSHAQWTRRAHDSRSRDRIQTHIATSAQHKHPFAAPRVEKVLPVTAPTIIPRAGDCVRSGSRASSSESSNVPPPRINFLNRSRAPTHPKKGQVTSHDLERNRALVFCHRQHTPDAHTHTRALASTFRIADSRAHAQRREGTAATVGAPAHRARHIPIPPPSSCQLLPHFQPPCAQQCGTFPCGTISSFEKND